MRTKQKILAKNPGQTKPANNKKKIKEKKRNNDSIILYYITIINLYLYKIYIYIQKKFYNVIVLLFNKQQTKDERKENDVSYSSKKIEYKPRAWRKQQRKNQAV